MKLSTTLHLRITYIPCYKPFLFTNFEIMYNLPVDYTKLPYTERNAVRLQYIKEQKSLCHYCGCSLNEEAPQHIKDKKINWKLFPQNFLQFPIHLRHNYKTGMTEGAVHNYCNAVMWQYEGR